jgi:hypothetical protein
MKGTTKSFVARTKFRFFTGTGFFGMVTGIMAMETFAKVWAETFSFYGIPPVVVYIATPIAYMVGCYGSGLAYEMSGLMGDEMSHQNKNVNPEIMVMIAQITEDNQNIKKILAKLEEPK